MRLGGGGEMGTVEEKLDFGRRNLNHLLEALVAADAGCDLLSGLLGIVGKYGLLV